MESARERDGTHGANDWEHLDESDQRRQEPLVVPREEQEHGVALQEEAHEGGNGPDEEEAGEEGNRSAPVPLGRADSKGALDSEGEHHPARARACA